MKRYSKNLKIKTCLLYSILKAWFYLRVIFLLNFSIRTKKRMYLRIVFTNN